MIVKVNFRFDIFYSKYVQITSVNIPISSDSSFQKSEDDMRDDISGMIPKTEGNVFKKEGDVLTPVKAESKEPPTTPEPSIAEKLRGKMYSDQILDNHLCPVDKFVLQAVVMNHSDSQ